MPRCATKSPTIQPSSRVARSAWLSTAASSSHDRRRLHCSVSNRSVTPPPFGPIVEWRGPAPYYFVAIPEDESEDIKFAAQGLEYWGQVPAVARIDDTEFTTALFPKDGRYLLPLKDAVRRAVGIQLDEVLTVAIRVGRD
jgi:hypothetical protein